MVAVVVIMAAMAAVLVGIRAASASSEVALPSPWPEREREGGWWLAEILVKKRWWPAVECRSRCRCGRKIRN